MLHCDIKDVSPHPDSIPTDTYFEVWTKDSSTLLGTFSKREWAEVFARDYDDRMEKKLKPTGADGAANKITPPIPPHDYKVVDVTKSGGRYQVNNPAGEPIGDLQDVDEAHAFADAAYLYDRGDENDGGGDPPPVIPQPKRTRGHGPGRR